MLINKRQTSSIVKLPASAASRAVAARVQLEECVVLFVSIYFKPSLPLDTDEMKEFMGELAATVLEHDLPFVIGGDWNTSPQGLGDYGWVRMMKATILHANDITCEQGMGSEIDYFVMSKAMLPFLHQIKVLHGGTSWPHRPVIA